MPSRSHLGRSLILAIVAITTPGESVAQHNGAYGWNGAGYGYRGYVRPYGYGAYPVYRGWGYGYRPYYGYIPYRPYYGGYYGYVGPSIIVGAVIPPPPPVYILPPPPAPPPPLPPPAPQAAPSAPPAHQCADGSTMGPGGYCQQVPVPGPERG